MAKCCCAPEIGAAKNEVLRALTSKNLPIVQQGTGSTIDIPVELIARRVADLLYPQQNTFQQTVLRELSAIIQALTALRGKDSDRDLLLLIARNTNDIYTQNAGNFRELSVQLATKSTQAQARDLLFAVIDSRRFVVDAINLTRTVILGALAAISVALAAMAAFALASKVAVLGAIAAATARILAAIAAIRIPKPDKVDLSRIESDLRKLLNGQLTLQEFKVRVPSCGVGEAGLPIVMYTERESYAVRDKDDRSTAQSTIILSEMVSSLMISGQLKCSPPGALTAEEILSEDMVQDETAVFFAFPSGLTAYWFTLEVSEFDEESLRTYKLAGVDSEYGAGNWSIVDGTGRACQSFTHIYNRSQRLDVPVRGELWGVRVSPKSGIAFTVRAFGLPFT